MRSLVFVFTVAVFVAVGWLMLPVPNPNSAAFHEKRRWEVVLTDACDSPTFGAVMRFFGGGR